MSAMNPLPFAIIGCGRIAASHIQALQAHTERARLTAVCDTDPARLRAAVEQTGARGYASLEELLAESEARVVSLCTPSGLHAAQGALAAASGRHVITEKPMATRWRDALNLVDSCDRAKVRLFVVKQNRYNATVQLLKRAVEAKRFGRIYTVAVNVFWSRPQSYYDSAKWRGTWEFDGGAFMNQASHYVDLLDWIVGPVESVHAFTGTLARDIEVEDTGVMTLRWRSGAMGTMNVTMLTYPRNFEGSITIIGETGTIKIGGPALNLVQQWEFSSAHVMDQEVASSSYETTSVYGMGHTAYYGNVLDALAGIAEPMTDGREGLKSLELLIAAYRSARDGRTVSLPLDY